MALLRPFPQPKSIEDAFLERYDVLLRVAVAITGGRREAEDLVQEAFVRLMLSPPDLETIVHLDAYLRTVLRNLHTARLRRRVSSAEAPLSIADFDAAPFVARALTPSQWTQARHDVAAACRYACTRRLTSKTGSVFLLRFVHEFVPSDIALIARLTRATVDVTLDRARAEVKTYLERPAHALRALGRELVPMSMPAVEPGVDDDDDYLALVRAAVFALRHKRCFDAAQLRELYASTHKPSITTPISAPILAELVTCPQCLDEVSRLLRLPPCAERHPRDPGQRTAPLREGDAARRDRPRDPGYARRATAAQRCRLVRAHRPRVLRMLVNGFEIGTHEIHGNAARVTQTLSILEPVWLAEVYSEQDVCLASLDVTPLPEASAEQRVDVALSDDRQITLALSLLKPFPTLHLVYEDPAGAAAVAAFSPEMADVDAEATDAPAIGPGPSLTTRSLKHVFHAWRDWLRATLRRPPRLAWWAATILIAGWLFWFTPGTQVSAAERLWRAIAALFTREVGPSSGPLPMPTGGPQRQQDISLAVPGPHPSASAPAAPLTPDALAELEIDALIVLHGRGALAGQRIQVTRSLTRVAVEGLVEGPDRDEIVRALREVPHGDALLVRLSTPADLIGLPRPRSSPSSNLRAVTLGRDAIPAADDLRQALARRAPGGQNGSATNVEAEVLRLANEGLQGARTGFLEAALLSTLADRFAALSGPSMADPTRPATITNKWRGLLAGQTDRVADAVDQVRTLLEPVFVSQDQPPAPGAAPPIENPPIDNPLSLADAARRLADDLGQVERATRAALTVAETPPDTIELRDAAFWRRLAATRERAAALKRQLVER
jgi:RNA polymerase sigma factor (sigma-70 family)